MSIEEFKKRITSVDIETTGVDIGSRIVEIGIDGDYILINPDMDIPPDASAVHGITNRLAKKHLTLEQMKDSIGSMLPTDIIVGHGVSFDIDIIKEDFGRAGVEVPESFGKKYICTLTLMRKLFRNEGIFDSFGLGYLWFALGLDEDHNEDSVRFHRAGFDTKATSDILDWILDYVQIESLINVNGDIYEELYKIMETPMELTTMPFGKHKGESFNDIPESYIKWCIMSLDALDENNDNYDADLALTMLKVASERWITV